ncbi:chloride channel protein [Elizabethkingia meningoseptica]|uniref:chloride channel protein n=1 Tax=Elizabethkingia meningoseptica TaxID=238 RepID=UPI0009993C08|nr:chloride channel protein [Elizabethkingia meningoseptica]MDE5439594.1 chloride channel protein [Elizabethkingia meningoseptica]MDE5510263.1 chloride channel protein [Elizabethkingia meningoseptica]MDE5517412.1 chloride channel protein [Elizabethkingia meningoseptica]MDE5528027.1 chloride channel protein [Elizabethkingia meningoseptica]MDE5531503.1 chloride channel protein [Elizabethkingia meningoseptica]
MSKNKKSKTPKFIRRSIYNIKSILGLLKIVLSERQFLYFSCVIVGVTSALAVTILKTFAHSVFQFTMYVNKILKLPYINSILPIVGIVLTVLIIRKFLNGSLEKGTAQIMIAVAKRSGFMPKKQMYAQIVTSSLTVGMGGSAGLESPITITGAALGSNYAQDFRLNYKDRTLLLACGVAAGIATAFNAPVAGVLFAIEVILADMSVSAFIPIMISSATGAIMSNLTLKGGILLSFKRGLNFDYHNTIYYVLLGIIAGFLSVYHARLFRKVEHSIGKYSKSVYTRAFVGAGILAVLIFLFPPLFGEGYENIKVLANNQAGELLDNSLFEHLNGSEWWILLFVLITMMIKAVATGLTLGSGGNGGNFAPSLFVGSYLGYLVSKVVTLIGIKNLPIDNFTVVGMAALLSGLFHAPLTAIFLIAEITGGYGLIIPLMLVSSISYAIAKRYDKYSMDIYTIADKGIVFTSDKDRNLLNKIDVSLLYRSNIRTVFTDFNTDEVCDIFINTDQYFIPVLSHTFEIKGVLMLNDVRKQVFSQVQADFTDAVMPANTASVEEDTAMMIRIMEDTRKDYILLTRNGRYAGYITKANIMDAYRQNLKKLRIE